MSRQLNLLSTATPAIGAWLVPIDQLKSSLRKLDMEGTLRVCAVMGCIMTEALEKKSIHIPIRSKYNRVTKRARYLHENPSCMLCNILHRYLQQADYSVIEEATMNDGVPALVTLKKGLVALARQWMKFIVVTQGFKAIGLIGPNQLTKAKEAPPSLGGPMGLDNGAALQSDTSADGAEFEYDAAAVSEHTMLLEGVCSRPPPKETTSGPVSGVEIMRKLSKSHTHNESALRIKGSHPYQSLSYTSGDTAADSPAHVSRVGPTAKDSPRKESLLSNLTGSFRSLHNLLEGTPQRNEPSAATAAKSGSLTRTGTDMLTEHPLLSEPSSVSFYNWMSNAVGNRTGAAAQESPLSRSQHNSLQTGGMCNLPTIPSASDFNTVLSSDQNTLDGTHSQHSTSQEDIVDIEEGNQCPAAVQLADAQVVFKPLLSYTGIQAQDATPLSYKMYFGEHLSFSGNLECLRADIVDSDTTKERKNKRSRRQGTVNLPPLEFKPALLIETFSVNAVVMEKSTSAPQGPTAAPLSFHDLNRRHYNTFHCDFTTACQAISQRVDMALVRLIHQFSTMIDDIKATQTDIKLSRYTAGSASPTPTFKARPYHHFRSSDFSRSSRGSLNGAGRSGTQTLKSKRGVVGGGGAGGGAGGPPSGPPSAMDTLGRREPRGRTSIGRSERRTSKVSRKGSRDVADHMAIQMDDSDSITVSEQSEPSAECWQNMYKLLNFYSLISDPTGILEKSSPENCLSESGRRPSEPFCKVTFENEQQEPATPNKPLGAGGRRRSLVSSEPQHVTLIVFGIGMVNRTHLEADIGGLTMEAELKKIHGSFTLKEKMKDILHQKMTETCASSHIGGINIVLLEGITPDIQLEDFPTSPTSTAKQEFLTVVKCNIAKSQALYSAQRGLKTNNAAVFKVGAIMINIPQHPATLHSMMVRSSHQLSKQIADLIRQPSNVQPPNREDTPTPQPSDKASSINQTPVEANEFPQLPEGLEKKPIVLKFSATMDGITIGAALLPSLKAEYKMGAMKSHGMTGAQTSFTFELPHHKLCFQSKVSPVDLSTMSPSASLTLPQVTMSGEYIMEDHESHSDQGWAPDDFPAKQGNYLQGNYLRCVAEIGSFEHNLTTDLLNHLVFLQKVFMKEVNEVIQKVSGGEQPIPLWNEFFFLLVVGELKKLTANLNISCRKQETIDPRRLAVTGNQMVDARGRKFTKRVVDIRELNEQAKVIDDLKKLGASEGTINQEIQRYQQLESVAVNDIRRDVRKKLRRSSMRAASLKDKWGLGYKPSYNRSKSISAAAGRPPPKRMDRQSSRMGDVDDFPDIRVDASSPGPRVTFNIQDTHDDIRRDDLSSSSSDDSEKEDEFERPSSYRRPLQTSHKRSSGFSAVSQLFSERWPTTPANRSFGGPTSEKNIDFELDVRVEIDSGKCVLHPTTQQAEQEDVSLRRSYDRSLRSLDQDSPPKKKKLQPTYISTSHLLAGKKCPSSLQTKPNDLETTVFYIPGVDVKLHYNSKTLKTESPNASRGSSLPRTLSKESKLFAKGKSIGGVKTAKLYAWVALQTLPEEMVISPCLLDFLEKALETIPITPVERNYTAVAQQEEDMGQFDTVEPLEESGTSLVSSSTSAYSSFPVDVVVYVRVQPSQIRFSCLPMSRVECMLKLPSLDLVFSSNRGELEIPTGPAPSEGSQPPSSTPPGQHVPKLPPSKASPLLGSPLGRSRHSSSQSDLTGPPSTSSGLSFTACMSDFSLYVFHPYGAGKQKSAVTGLPPGPGPLGTVDEEPSSVTGRKDSLSINLEFVKVSLSRMRRTGGPTFIESFAKGGKMDTTLINISAVCDIGSASFKYDMRRLSEILAFPRAWYRRSIARRLFLGDQTINLPAASGPATPDSAENITQHLSPESSRKAYWRTWDGSTGTHIPQSPNVFSEHSTGSLGHLKSPAPGRTRSVSDSSAPRRDSVSKTSTPSFGKNGKSAGQQGSPWETLVVFAINLKQLTVQMNMSNVMGNNTWTTSGLKSQGRLSVGSNRDREISMSVGLGRSKLDSKGGVVGGNIDVNTLEMVSHISEHPNQQPSHKIQITMGSTEARVDYMGSSILMGVFSNADLQLQDEWKVNLCSVDNSLSEKSEIFVHGDLQWDIFQVIISRSTTPDLIKIGMKLQEFFTQQFDTSKRALSTWGPGPYVPPKTPVISTEKGSAELYMDAAHHRHWPGVLKVVAGCHISLFQMPLPEDAVQLGGSMSLHGNHMTLACFHGPNFRSKSWALFHLEEPNIAFWTEAQKIWEDGSKDDSTYIVQTLDFHLGHNTMVTKPCGALESPMAIITKITRRRHENPPHGVATVKEWFNYVTAMRHEELNLLRNVEANNPESGAAAKSSSLLSSFRSSHSYNHENETIFALPRMQLDFKSIHVQDPDEPVLTDSSSKPKVECSMVTEFTDHICVTMDAELIMFLHDLVSAYLKEKEKALFAPRMFVTRPGQKSPTALQDDDSTNKDKDDGINCTTVDWREFMCNTWHLEPTLRLISWTGRKIDPVGVDYILQKLGFHHARTTIPKWLQRGVMDPLDKVLSVLIKKLGTALQDEKEKKGRDKEEH
uniref:KIAA1109 n=1 Tax=Nothobranchius kadleci TaxID=1051664 RepID=A0A1A8BHT7_NOTKA